MTDTTTPDTDVTRSRETWLRRAVAEFRTWINEVSGIEVPDVLISIGFGGVRYERGVAAVCYPRSASSDGKNQIFISPECDDTADILVSVLHELVHAALDCQDGHRGRFAEYCTRLGLTAPFTVSEPDVATAARMMVIAAELGPFPHGKLTVRAPRPVPAPDGTLVTVGGPVVTSSGAPDKNRWISFQCPTHGRPVRMSKTAAAEGAPFCGHRDEQGVPCLTEMLPK